MLKGEFMFPNLKEIKEAEKEIAKGFRLFGKYPQPRNQFLRQFSNLLNKVSTLKKVPYSLFKDWVWIVSQARIAYNNENSDIKKIVFSSYFYLESLLNKGLLIEIPGERDSIVWAIPRSRIQVSSNPNLLRCDNCGDTQAIPSEQFSIWNGMPCLVRHCKGVYKIDPRGGLSLYKRLYEKGEINRIVAKEHTGLLPRPDREMLEKKYIRGKYRSDPNLLSATSTLEMGIDIGDLSTVLLASVPPEPANYLQRIGRAGRRDGNALVGTLVTGTSHDLFFFLEPKEMLKGQIRPPGCYLDAPAILRRQLMAYTLDRWVQSEIDTEHLPQKLKSVLDAVEKLILKNPNQWIWSHDRWK